MMNIRKLDGTEIAKVAPRRMTEAAMQQDFEFMIAEKLTRQLLDQGLITEREFNKIMAKNRETFSPYFAEIMA